MKNAKKLLLLLLSFVLLIGVFTVAALADDNAADAATVVYPDGSVETYAVGDTIVPKEMTDGLYYGKNNTLFKDDATAGWIFTVKDGAALGANLTVTEALAGKTIVASGFNKVYYTSEEKVSGETTMVYHLKNDVHKFFSTSNTGDASTGAHSYEVLRTTATEHVVVKLYEDVLTDSFAMDWFLPDPNRLSGRPCYIDLNGHTVVNNTTATLEIKGVAIRLFSSVPGGCWYQPNSATAFYVSDDASLVIGNNSTSNATYSDNLSVYCKSLFNTMYGSGAYVVGGHYYQVEGATGYMVRMSRRLYQMQNASFYVQDGNAVFGDPDDHSSQLSTVTSCKFYTNGTSDILTGSKSAAMSFTSCAFYGINTSEDEGIPATAVTATLAEDCTKNPGVSYSKVTWFDGTTDFYYAEDVAKAEVMVNSFAKASAPYGKWVDGEYYVALSPAFEYTYDASFNAVQTIASEILTKVYFAVELSSGETIYYLNKDTAGADLKKYMTAMDAQGSTVVLYSDIDAPGFGVNGKNGKTYRLDLNGYKLTITSANTDSFAMDVYHTAFYLYSSREGGELDASATPYWFRSNDGWYGTDHNYGKFYIGESDTSGESYGKNLTVYCKAINGDMYGTSTTFNGGTFIQVEGSTSSYFLRMGRGSSDNSHVQDVKNCTFITTNPSTAPLYLRCSDPRSFTNCTFISSNQNGGVALNAYTGLAKVFTFNNCNFINVQPYLGSSFIVYDEAAFGTTGVYSMADLDVSDAAAYLAHGADVKTITANGKTYALDGVIVSDPSATLKITHESVGADYWVVGAKVSVALDEIEKIEGDKVLCDAYFDYSAISQITDGIVTAAGEGEAKIGFAGSRDIAFTYTTGGVLYAVTYDECGSTPAGVGDKFYELFNAPTAEYEIVMYKDMLLTKGVHFGALVKHSDSSHNRDYYASFAYGNITWDLNGTTVTIDKNVTGVANLAAANHAVGSTTWNSPSPAVFGFEHDTSSNGLILKTSKAGAQIINESTYELFGIGEGKTSMITIYGEGLTVTSMNARIFNSIEISDGTRHKIYGGTYISGAASGVGRLSAGTIIENATFINTNASAERVLHMDGYRSGAISLKNVTFVSAKQGAPAINVVGGSKQYSITAESCTFIGAATPVTGGRFSSVAYSGTTLASNVADLAAAYASAPADTTLAATSVKANGADYKVYGYFANTTGFVTVEIPLASLTELWVAGGTFVAPAYNADINVVEKDGKIYYRANPIWAAKIEGVVVEDILATANAGKTVVLDVDGDLETVYAIRNISGTKTYYYGENAAAELVTLFAAMGGSNSTITFYEDITLTTNVQGLILRSGGQYVSHYIDLNGHKLTINYASSVEDPAYGLYFKNGSTYVYSSAPGAVIDASIARMLMMTDDGANAYVGENINDGSTNYGKNLTVICKAVFAGRLWSNNGYIIGGTYIQNGVSDIDRMLAVDDGPVPTIRNSTFIADYYLDGFVRCKTGVTVTGCTFIAKNATKLVAPYSGAIGASFKDCYFYNVIPNVPEAATVTYENCYFDTASMIAQNGGYIAFTGENVVKNVNGADYTFAAKFVAEATLVDWGFGIQEYWENGVTASHANVEFNGLFAYSFNSFVVGEGEAEATMIAMKSGTISMFATLQSQIGVTLTLSEDLLGATIRVFGAEFEITEDTRVLSTTIAPNAAYGDTVIVIIIDGIEHEISVSLEDYAKAILASNDAVYAAAHNLTYAMIEYVRAMIPADKTFCEGVDAPAGYEAKVLVAEESANGEGMLENIAFCLDGTIAIAINGKTEAIGKNVNLVLANGRSENATVNEDGTVLFEGLYVNEFFGEMTITVEGEIYTYSLANYLKGIGGESAAVQALYNYAFYANAYVATLVGAN